MSVLLQNPAILLLLLVAVARFVGKRFAAGKRGAAGAAPSAEEAERTRRVKEEVARKVAERRRAAMPPVVARQRAEAPPVRPAPRPSPSADIDEVLTEQQNLVDQMRVLEGAQAPSASGGAVLPSTAVPVADGPRGWLPELGDPRGARRAMVLREVLGPPVGLR
jgi:hypothetical protein